MNFYKSKAFRAVIEVYKRASWIRPFMPRQIRVEETKACNLRCYGCRRPFAGNISRRGGEMHLPLDALTSLIEQVPSVRLVRYGGDGEPTVNPHFVQQLYYLKAMGIKTSFTTNGTLMDERLTRICEECGNIRISLSLNGGRRETVERMRSPAKFDQIVENARNIGRSRIPLFLNFAMLTESLLDEIPEFIRVAKDVGAIGVQFLKPMRDPQFFTEPDFVKVEGMLGEARALSEESGLYCEGCLNPLPTFRQCYDSFVAPLITLNGDVFPCSYSANQLTEEWYEGECIDPHLENYVMGNVNSERLRDIWRNNSYRELRRTVKETSQPIGRVVSREELQEMRHSFPARRFGYCAVCLDRWMEAGS